MSRSGSNKRQRTRVLKARFNEAEAASIQKMAESSGLSVAAMLRTALFNAPPPPSRRRPSINHQAVVRLMGQLGKIGSNINQLAKHANAGRDMDRMSDSIEYALRDLAEMRFEIMRALGVERGITQTDDET